MNDNDSLSENPLFILTIATRIVATLHFAGVAGSVEAREALIASAIEPGVARERIVAAVNGMLADISGVRSVFGDR